MLKFETTGQILATATLALGLAACSNVTEHSYDGGKVTVKEGTDVYDHVQRRIVCGTVALTVDVQPKAQVYGEQPFGTWDGAYVFPADAIQLKPGETCGDTLYVMQNEALPASPAAQSEK